MANKKGLIDVWKINLGASAMKDQIIGPNGYHWLSGGRIPPFMTPLG